MNVHVSEHVHGGACAGDGGAESRKGRQRVCVCVALVRSRAQTSLHINMCGNAAFQRFAVTI